MNVAQLLDELRYSDSPNFLRPGSTKSFDTAADFSHIFRRASRYCRLHGVYALRQSGSPNRDSIVPVVYVCEAADEADAQRIHRMVWNQNVAPFLIVVSSQAIRLHSGFRYERPRDGTDPVVAGILGVATDTADALKVLDGFRAERIDDGSVWDRWGDAVTPETRVDWKLLSALNDLDAWLQSHGLDSPELSHALIGKYVYLSYLRHRDILSDRKLDKWQVRKEDVFSRNATVGAFARVVDHLDEWLNGSMFPLPASADGWPAEEHIRKVAGTFSGDDPEGQLSLDFDVYDFSFIPIETLSVIYEQFLHSPGPNRSRSRGRVEGAYYTPIPLVNFMLEELDALRPLEKGMRVLDPACGSGAFLVQCYRRLIEQDVEFHPGDSMRPARLRDLLRQHIFGIDRDSDACRVAELSLSLTLLDYVDPPDLERMPRFRLPQLRDTNIFHGDFFDPHATWRATLSETRFDWVVGNPPWLELKRGKISESNRHVWQWMQDRTNQKQFPVGGNQVAEAFSWAVTKYLAEAGVIALLLPAMTLFKDESRRFREQFFSTHRVHAVANFANLAEVLFPGHRYTSSGRIVTSRPRRPAAALFYSHGDQSEQADAISVFSPLVVDQRANLPPRAGGRKDTWNFVVNANQLRLLDVNQVSDGSALPWKTSMWGSHLDLRLLRSVASRFATFDAFCRENNLTVAEGFQLRHGQSSEPIDPTPELVGRQELKMEALRRCGRLFEFPDAALERITPERANLRIRGGRIGLSVSRPPHVIVDEARRFAVYSDKFIAVPARQIGIRGSTEQADLLKTLSLYLVSDFATYHQFLVTPQWGISTSVSTLRTLRQLPVPLSRLGGKDLARWADLHSQLVQAAKRVQNEHQSSLFADESRDAENLSVLLRQLNDAVFDLLQLRTFERTLVSDLVHLRMQLVQGKIGRDAHNPPIVGEMIQYAATLRDELDAFVDDQPGLAHSVIVFHNGSSAMVAITLNEHARKRIPPRLGRVDGDAAAQFDWIRQRVRDQHSQWIYFDRNLRIYEGRSTYLFKPLQRLQWTQSQALLDAGCIIADTLNAIEA